jgi:hypothetical protein
MVRNLSAAALAVLAFASSQTASAEVFHSSAQHCQPRSDMFTGDFSRDGRGVFTQGTSPSITVICGLDMPHQLLDVNAFQAWYYDRRQTFVGSGSVDNVSCWLETWSSNFSFVSPTKFGCSAFGGCTSDPGAFTGAGVISMNNPINGGNSFLSLSLSLTCRIPPAATPTTDSSSFLTSYGIDAVPGP